MEIATWLAGAALVVAATTAVQLLRVGRRLGRLEDERRPARRRASRFAHLTASLLPAEEPGRYNLNVFNRGPGPARDVRVSIDGARAPEHPSVFDGPEDGFALEAGGGTRYRMSLAIARGRPPWPIRVEWEDDSGPDRSTDTVVTA